MSFKIHDNVLVTKLNQVGKVIDVNQRGSYTVLIGNLTIQCRETELSPASDLKKRKPKAPQKNITTVQIVKRSKPPKSLDLHGYFVADAIHALEDTINDCILSGAHELEIIHGIGTGKVKEAVLKYLRTSPLIRNFKEAEGNPGTTRAFF